MAIDPALKQLLTELVVELQDVRANSIVLAQQVGAGIHPSVAQSLKASALAEIQTRFDKLIEKVNAL